jgi:hypothetical protein
LATISGLRVVLGRPIRLAATCEICQKLLNKTAREIYKGKYEN